MTRHVAPVRTDVSEERIASIISVVRIGELGRTLAVTTYLLPTLFLTRSNKLVTAKVVPRSLIFFTLMIGAIRSSETSVLTRTTRRHVPEVEFFNDCIISIDHFVVSRGHMLTLGIYTGRVSGS
jgi:hypothetical protein